MVAHPIFSHPIQNFSVVQFDPSLVKGSYSAAVLSSKETEHDEEGEEDDQEEDTEDEGTGADSDTDSSGSEEEEEEEEEKEEGGGDAEAEDGGCVVGGSETTKPAAGEEGEKTREGEEGKATEAEHDPPEGSAMPSSPPPPPPPPPTTTVATQVANSDGVGEDSIRQPPSNVPGDAGKGRSRDDSDHDSPPPLRPGDTAEFYGLTAANAPVRQRAAVVKLERISLPTSAHPQFTAHSVEVRTLEGTTAARRVLLAKMGCSESCQLLAKMG